MLKCIRPNCKMTTLDTSSLVNDLETVPASQSDNVNNILSAMRLEVKTEKCDDTYASPLP